MYPEGSIIAIVTGDHTIELTLNHPNDFFRIITNKIISKLVKPEIGFTYQVANVQITITDLNIQNKPNRLKIDMGTKSNLKYVLIWNGVLLISLAENKVSCNCMANRYLCAYSILQWLQYCFWECTERLGAYNFSV